jgi:hypothetical protein
MQDYQTKATGCRPVRRDETTVTEDLSPDQSMEELRPRPGFERLALLDAQPHRDVVWRWHVRRRTRS